MAATSVTSGAFGNLIKLTYEDTIQNQMTDEAPVMKALEDAGADEVQLGVFNTNTAQVSGFTFRVQTGMGGSVMHRNEATSTTTGLLAPAREYPAHPAGVQDRECYGRVNFTAKEIAAGKRRESTFASALEYKMDSLAKETRRVAGASLWGKKPMTMSTTISSFVSLFETQGTGTGEYPTGVLAQASAGNSAATVTCDFFSSPQHLWPGRRIAWGTETEWNGGTGDSGGEYGIVDSVTLDSTSQITITHTATVTVANNDFAVAADSVTGTAADGDPNEFNLAIHGIPHIAVHPDAGDNDGICNIDCTAVTSWLPSASMYEVGTPTRARLTNFFNNVRIVSGETPTCAFMHPVTMTAIEDTIDPDVRYERVDVELTGGYNTTAFYWNCAGFKVPMLGDHYAPLGDLYTWSWKKLKLGYLEPDNKWRFIESPDGNMFHRSANQLQWDLVYGTTGWNTVCFQRNSVAAMTGITYDSTQVAIGA